MEQIKRDLMHAGYLGMSGVFKPDKPMTEADGYPLYTAAIPVANACDATNVGRISQRIWAYHESNPYAGSCIPAANYLRGDVLVIRGLDPTPVAPPFSPTTAYYHSAYDGGAPFVELADAAEFCDRIRSAPPRALPQFPDQRNGVLRESLHELADGVAQGAGALPAAADGRAGDGARAGRLRREHFQVRYAWFDTDEFIRYKRADELAGDAWDRVRSVQVFLLDAHRDAGSRVRQ